jgi:hypothetical protein
MASGSHTVLGHGDRANLREGWRWAIAFVLTLLAGLLAPVLVSGVSDAAVAPTDLTYACALKSNGNMRVVTSPTMCKTKETLVTIKPGPVMVCVQPSGSTRYVTAPKQCRPPATRLTLPPTTGIEYFCAAISSGVLRHVADPNECTSSERAFQVTPNDAAPSVTATSPIDGASHVSTASSVSVTFSESVTASSAAVSMTCDGSPIPAALSGSPGTTLTLSPDATLAQDVGCQVTVTATMVSDTDANDPPDHPTANYSFAFTTDKAPSVTSTTPNDGATDVDPNSNVDVNFSEPVTFDASSFGLLCDSSPVAFGVTGSGTDTATITPDNTLPGAATCSATVKGAKVSDVDGGDPPDTIASDATIDFTTADAAPSVVSTTPDSGATAVGPKSDIDITFSEPVTASVSAFSLECPTGSAQSFALSGSPGTTLSLDPTSNLPSGEVCTVKVAANRISDVDAADPPDGMASGFDFSFTVSPNSAPTDISLSSNSIDENNAVGDVVGDFTTTDPDALDTFTYALVSGTGSDDNGAFTISGDQLLADESFDSETDSSYSIRVSTTDDIGNTFEKQFTITVNDVDEAPNAGPDTYTGAIGNTLAVVGTTGSGPQKALSGDVLTANDLDPEGTPVTAVAETVGTTGGGSATINADGSFTYLPGVGDKSMTDTFTYHVTDGVNTSSGSASVGIDSDIVWYVDGDYAGGGSD